MHELLEKAGIPHRTGITTKDTREPLDQLINYSNTTWFIYLESNGNAILHRPAMLFPVKCLPACKAKKPYWKTTHALPFPPPPPKTTGIWLP